MIVVMNQAITLQQSSSISKRAIILSATLLAALFLFVNSMNPLSNTPLAENDYLIITSAQALPLNINISTLDNHADEWVDIEFPIHWRNQFSGVTDTWYRINLSNTDLEPLLTRTASNETPALGVYIWRLNQTADIWFNGSKIGSGSSTDERMARQWNRPLYFSVPPSMLQENNELLIKHHALHGWGSMEPIVIGRENILNPIYDFRIFIQHDIALGLFVFVLSTAIFSFAVWFYRRQESQYFWFALASVGLSIYCLNQFVQYTFISADAWRWIVNISTDFWASCLLIFLLRSLNVHRPTVEKIAIFYVLIGIPVYFYASFFKAFQINIYFHIGSLATAIYSFYLCISNYRATKNGTSAFYCAAIVPVFAAGVHDTVMQANLNLGLIGFGTPNFQNHFNFLHFVAPLLFLFIAASLMRKFIDSMNAVDTLNIELEQRIEEARQELSDNYDAIEDALKYQSASEERERIYRDLHDDVGSKLLSLYYRLDNVSDSTLAKSALEDLRDIVSRKSLESILLNTAVQQWHNEALNRVSDANIPLTWNFDTDDKDLILDELQHTHLRRMLREVLSNAILHGKSVSEIRVKILCKNGELALSIANDGAEKPSKQWSTGRGLSNLKIRTRDLQGEFSTSDLEGSWVELAWKIPLNIKKGGE